jgi:hypothetical protein
VGEEYVCVVEEDRGKSRAVVSDEIRATIIDPVINHGLSMREAGLRMQPNLQLNSGIYCEKFQAKQQVRCAFCKGV